MFLSDNLPKKKNNLLGKIIVGRLCQAVLIKQNDAESCAVWGKKRAKEKQRNSKTYWLYQHACLYVPIALYLVHSPKGLIILCAGWNTKAASLYLCPSSSPQREFETLQIYLFVSFRPYSDSHQSDIALFVMHTGVGPALW